MQPTVLAPLAIAVALLAAACTDTAGPPKTLAQRNEVMDNFLTTGPMVSGGLPPANPGVQSP